MDDEERRELGLPTRKRKRKMGDKWYKNTKKTEKSNNFVKKSVFFLEVIIIFCIFATED